MNNMIDECVWIFNTSTRSHAEGCLVSNRSGICDCSGASPFRSGVLKVKFLHKRECRKSILRKKDFSIMVRDGFWKALSVYDLKVCTDGCIVLEN